jgi:hypothetical protein
LFPIQIKTYLIADSQQPIDMDKNDLPKFNRITIKQKNGQQVTCGLKQDIRTKNWFALVPSAPIGEVAGCMEELTDCLIGLIIEQSDGTLFLDLSNK